MKDKWPSVTAILSPWQNFDSIPPDVLEAAKDRGSAVHRICAAILQGLFVAYIPDECQPYIDSFVLWEPYIEEVIAVEKRFSCPVHRFTGQPDLICRLRGHSELTLVDFKTPRALSRSWRLQVGGGYRHLAKQEYDITQVFSLRLSPDGKFPIVKEYEVNETDFLIFLNARSVYQFFNGR